MNLNTPVVSTVIKNYKYSQNAFLPKIITIPLTLENDLIYTALVKPGDIVKEGQCIAKTGEGNDISCLHSSLPGKVLDICPCYSPNGKQDFGIKIQFGGAFSFLGKLPEEHDMSLISSASIVPGLIEKGVVNTFYTSKPENLGLQIKNNPDYKNVIVRLFDEDPYRITDSLISKFFMEEVLKGAQILAKAIEATGIIFVCDQKEELKGKLQEKEIPNFRVLEMNIKKYPCGTPREIISAFKRLGLKKTCNFEIKKSDLFIDASTAYEVYKSIICSIPAISRPVHFSGNCLYSSCLLDVKIGTPVKDIVAQLGGFAKEPAKIIINGELCGSSIQSLETPITKYVKSVEFISSNKVTDTQIYSCINCGNCRFVCPVKISPDILYNNTVNFKLLPETFAASSLACINCGLCNTVCPARLPLSQTITFVKSNLSNN